MAAIPLKQEVFYPASDGKPMGETDVHITVTVGIPSKPKRRSYFLWREGRPPTMIIEVTSEGSRQEDQEKKELYARLGVEEYFLDDPLDEYLEPPLQGYRLVGGRYEPIEPDEEGMLLSRTTGLLLHRDGEGLQLVDAKTRRPLHRMDEQAQALDEQAQAIAEQARVIQENERVIQEKDRALVDLERALQAACEEIARLGGR